MKTDRDRFFMTPKPIIKKICNLSSATSDSTVRHSVYVMFNFTTQFCTTTVNIQA